MSKYILVLDDDADILEVIKIILEEKNYEVRTLSDSNLIYQTISERTPDLILLDIWMSGIDGQEIASKLKKGKFTKQIPIIMISANNEGKKIAKLAQVNDYIAKPFEIDSLIKMVDKYLS